MVAGAQLPVPSQVRVEDAMPEVQLAATHTVDEPGYAPQTVRSEPLQTALQTPVPLHVVRPP